MCRGMDESGGGWVEGYLDTTDSSPGGGDVDGMTKMQTITRLIRGEPSDDGEIYFLLNFSFPRTAVLTTVAG